MTNTVKLFSWTKIFSPLATTNRCFHANHFQNLPLLRRYPAYLPSTVFLPTQSVRFPTLYKSSASTHTSNPYTPIITDDYNIVPIRKEDTERALQFLRRFFFREEPLCVAQNLLETDDDTSPEFEEYSVKTIHENVSLMATATNGDIVGVCLNGILSRDVPKEENYECSNEKYARMLRLLETVEREANIFGQFPDVNKILEMKMISLDVSWRGRGIAETFVAHTRDLCREHGLSLIRVDCTSYFSARILARLGFECVYELKYTDYKENDKVVFVPEPPHSKFTIYTQRVTSLLPRKE